MSIKGCIGWFGALVVEPVSGWPRWYTCGVDVASVGLPTGAVVQGVDEQTRVPSSGRGEQTLAPSSGRGEQTLPSSGRGEQTFVPSSGRGEQTFAPSSGCGEQTFSCGFLPGEVGSNPSRFRAVQAQILW